MEVHRIAAKIADSLKNLTLEHASMAQVLMANHKIHNRPAILESRAFESSQSDSIEEVCDLPSPLRNILRSISFSSM